MSIIREDLDGIVFFFLARLVQKLLAKKNSLVLEYRYFDFVDLCGL